MVSDENASMRDRSGYSSLTGPDRKLLRQPSCRYLYASLLGVAFFYGCALLLLLVVSLFTGPPPFRSTCALHWSCTTPLARTPADAWPSPRPELDVAATSRWHALHDSHVQQARRARGSRLVFLGDSITEGWLRTGLSARGESIAQPACGAIWRRAFGRWRPLNFGIGGDRVQDLGWRLQHGLLGAQQLQPQVFVLLIGTNDLGNGESADVALAEVRALVGQLRRSRPAATVVVHGVLPRGGDEGVPRTPSFRRGPWWDARRNNYHASIAQLNRGLRALAEEEEEQQHEQQQQPQQQQRGGGGGGGRRMVRWLSCSRHLLRATTLPAAQLEAATRSGGGSGGGSGGRRNWSEAEAEAGAEAGAEAEELFLPIEWFYDLLHLTPAGYERWADCLTTALSPLLGGGESAAGHEQPTDADASTTATCVGRSCRGGADPGGVDLP